jgi:hypothetical protein
MKKKVRIYKKPCYKCGGNTHMQTGGQFEPHMMYDPKTGKGYPAETMEDHLAMKERGFLHKDEMPKKQFGGNQFSKRLGKELKSSYKPFSSTAPQNQNTDEVVGERKNIFVSSLSNNAFKKYAEEEQQSLQELHQQMKMGGNTSYAMYDQYGGQYPTDEYMPEMKTGGVPLPEYLKKLKKEDKTQYFYALLKAAEKKNNQVFKYAFYDEGFGDWDDFYEKYKGDEKYTKGAKEALKDFYKEGAVEEDAVIDYLEALTFGNPAQQLKAADTIEKYDIDWSVNWGFDSNQNKLSDMAEVIREQSRKQLYKNRDEQYKQFQNNYQDYRNLLVKKLDAKIAEESDLEKKKELQTIKNNLKEADNIIGDKESIGAGKDYDKVGIWSDDYTEFSLHEGWNKTFHEAYTDFIKAYDEHVAGKDESKKLQGVYPGIRKGYFYDNPNAATWLSTGYREEADQQLADALYSANKKTNKNSGKVKTQEQSFTSEEKAAAEEVLKQRALKEQERAKAEAAAKAAAQQQPKPVQQQQPKVVPVQRRSEPNVVKSKPSEKSTLTPEQKAAILKMRGAKKYGGNIDMYQDGGQPEDYMNVPGDAFRNIYSNDELREKLNNRFTQVTPQDIQAEEQPEMFPAFKDLKWYDKQTTGFDKYAYGSETTFDPPNMITAHNNPYLDKLQQLAGSFNNPFAKIAWGAREAANYVGDMFSNPNKDFGYSTMDGIQIRKNRKGDEKIDLMGTYANRFRQNPVGTVGATLANIAQTAAPIARNISRIREDNRYDALNQKMKMADNVFSPVDNPQERGNWTTNQGYFNPDLMTMQPWFTGQNYQYGGDVVEMTDQEIENFLRAGGQIEYLD